MSYITISSGLTLKVPTKGTTNWNDTFLEEFAKKISSHDHTGSGKGTQIGASAIAAGAVTTTSFADGAVTLAKMASITTDRLIGRDTAGTGVPELLTVTGGLEFGGSGGIVRSALTGDVTAAQSSNTTTIAALAVTAAKLAADAVTTVKILDANVTNAKLASSSVNTTNYVDASINAAKLASGSVTSAKLSIDGDVDWGNHAITNLYLGAATKSAAGSDQAGATLITTEFTYVTAGTGGVRLPTVANGNHFRVANLTLSAVNVYPPTGANINGLSANAPVSLASLATAEFNATSGTQVYGL